MASVRLQVIDDGVLERLLAVAIAQAEPGQVMPVDGPGGWTPARQAAFREFHRAHYGGLDGPRQTVMFAIEVGPAGASAGETVGMIRMSRCGQPGVVQTGMWLGRLARGRGIGTAALRALLVAAAAAGAHTIIADTTTDNEPALRMLRRCGAELTPHEVTGPRVDAVLRLTTPDVTG